MLEGDGKNLDIVPKGSPLALVPTSYSGQASEEPGWSGALGRGFSVHEVSSKCYP